MIAGDGEDARGCARRAGCARVGAAPSEDNLEEEVSEARRED